MNRRENLANDIGLFNEKENTNEVVAEKWFVQKSAYLNLINRIFQLTIDDFETNEKYNLFFEYINHNERKKIIQFIEISFNDNHLSQDSYLMLANLFIRIEKLIK